MKNQFYFFLRTFILLFLIMGRVAADDFFHTQQRLWTPEPDNVYLEQVSQKIPTTKPVQSVAFYDGTCYAVMENHIYTLDDQTLNKMSGPEQTERLLVLDNKLWALSKAGLYILKNKNWKKLDDQHFKDMCIHQGAVHAATREDVYRIENETLTNIKPKEGYLSSDKTMLMADGTQVLADPVRFGPIERIDSYSGTLYALRPGQLVLFDGAIVNEEFIDWGAFPSPNTHDMLALGSRLFITTDRGLAVLRGAALTTLDGKDRLPYEATTCLAKGFDNDLWIGTTTGAIRMLKDEWHYFGPYHWLPGDYVNDIAVHDKSVYIATNSGIGIIKYEPYTLLKKAAFYERHINEWGHKRLGFVHSLVKNDKGEWIRHISDNDGGHTAPYLAAMCFKYAVTGDEKAREEAVDAFKAMIWLDKITPKDGFIARAIWSTTGDQDKMGRHGSGGLPAKWYPTEDGKWYWKGDTSSDEVTAHYYSVSIFHDLVAKGREKELAKEHLEKIASHIIDNGFLLRDMDDKPTRWGRWDPDYLQRPYGQYAIGLNGVEIQSFLLAAYGVSGDKKFKEGYQQVLDWGYHHYTVRQKITFPPKDIAPWDDNLASRCYYTLFRYTDDPIMRSIYLRSLERTWELKRMEHVSLYSILYGAITGNDCELDLAVKHLREWTLDCVVDSYKNSHRSDLAPEPGYVPYGGGTRGMSPRETSVKGGSRNALPYDGGAGGRVVADPTGFLRDYWMARYHGMIKAPTVTDPDLISVKPHKGQQFGAKPYNGPPRPEIN